MASGAMLRFFILLQSMALMRKNKKNGKREEREEKEVRKHET